MTTSEPKNRNASVRFGFSVVADRIPSISVGRADGGGQPKNRIASVSAVADRTHPLKGVPFGSVPSPRERAEGGRKRRPPFGGSFGCEYRASQGAS